MNRLSVLGVMTAIGLSVSACGGGGGGSGSSGTGNPPPAQGSIAGTTVKGPVSGATVTAYGISSGSLGAQIASGTTDAEGHFSLAMGSYAGTVMLQMSGGTFTDEATGAGMSMMSGNVMTALVPGMTAGATLTGIQMTPLTSMAQTLAQHLQGGMTDANATTANMAVGDYYMVNDILHTQPMDPLATGSGNMASQDAMNYGLVLAGMSQFAKDQGMASSSAMVPAMASDASDGVMDGRMSGGPVMMMGMNMTMPMPSTAGTSGLATAMAEFMTSAQNRSGVTVASMQTLMSKLNGSDGHMMGSAGGGAASSGTVSGTVFNGPVNQATVTAYAIQNGSQGAQITSATAGPQGTFMLSLGDYSGPVMLRVTAGGYTDEATGTMMAMGAGDVMTAVIPSISGGATMSDLWVTPLTSMAQTRAQSMSGGMVPANITAANAAVGNYFIIDDILHTMPVNPLVEGSGAAASADQQDCGIAIAAMSQYAKQIGMAVSSAMVTAMMNDASDGTMNGRMGGSQISMGGGMMGGGGMMQSNAGTTGLATAMTDFMSSAQNRSGLTAADMNALIQKLAASNGQL